MITINEDTSGIQLHYLDNANKCSTRGTVTFCTTAHQREIETDEAVQRAAQAMVPNPIYSGSPVYEEIVDAKMLKSLKRKEKKAGAIAHVPGRDEGYVEISPEAAVRMMSAFPIPEESKLVNDKYATISVSETDTGLVNNTIIYQETITIAIEDHDNNNNNYGCTSKETNLVLILLLFTE